MKLTLFTLALVPTSLAAEGIKLWNQKSLGNLDQIRCYATADNNDGCVHACKRQQLAHVFFNDGNWWAGTHFGRFTDPRNNQKQWLNIWPESDHTWGLFRENGDGRKIGWCLKTNDRSCTCSGTGSGSASAFAYCVMNE